MASDNYLSVKCPRCGNQWHANLDELDQPGPQIYKGADPDKSTREYRAKCPNCDTYTVFEVPERSGDE